LSKKEAKNKAAVPPPTIDTDCFIVVKYFLKLPIFQNGYDTVQIKIKLPLSIPNHLMQKTSFYSRFIPIPLLAFIVSSCCGAYQTEYVDPLFGEKRGKFEKCPMSPCPPDSDNKNCKVRPWLNVEYEKNDIHLFKIGAAYLGYTPKFMYVAGANYLYSPSDINGINAEVQVGALPYKYIYTTFLGVDYGRWNKNVNSQVVSPHVGLTIPYSFLRNTQFKFGYNIGFKDPVYSGFFGAINVKLPLFHLF